MVSIPTQGWTVQGLRHEVAEIALSIKAMREGSTASFPVLMIVATSPSDRQPDVPSQSVKLEGAAASNGRLVAYTVTQQSSLARAGTARGMQAALG